MKVGIGRQTVSIHDVKPEYHKHFSCGHSKLDEYLKRYAKGNHKKGVGKTFVLVEDRCVIGFYTLSMSAIDFKSLPKHQQIGLPRYPLPTAKIGRLAVDKRFQSKGIGKFLLINAFQRVYEASQHIGTYGIVVDAKDDKAKNFYKHFGFIECQDNEFSLFLLMKTVHRLFSSSG